MLLTFSPPQAKTKKQAIKRTNVVFVQKKGVYYVSLPEKSVKDYIYPPEMVVDGDVINRDSLYASLLNWITTLNIKAIDTYCIVSEDSVFEKTFYPNIKSKTINEAELASFTDSIPYQRITTLKKTNKDGSQKVIVANRDLLSVVLHALEQNGLSVVGAFPDFQMVYDGSAPIKSSEYLGDRASDIVTLYETKPFDEYYFDVLNKAPAHKPLTQMSVTEAAQQPIDPVYAILAVVILVVIAAGIGYFQYAQVKQKQLFIAQERARLAQEQKTQANVSTDPIPVSAQNPLPTATVIPAEAPSASPSAALENGRIIRIQLLYSSQNERLYEDVRSKLQRMGGYQITGEISETQSTTNRILASPALSAAQSGELVETLNSMGISAEIKQATIDSYDVVVELNVYSPAVPSPFATTTP